MLLLDTHVFLWCITADPKLPAPFRVAIQDPGNEVFLSAVSVWEAVIKCGLGKLPLPSAPAEYLPQQRAAHGISPLPVDEGAMSHLTGLAPLHRDPFDRTERTGEVVIDSVAAPSRERAVNELHVGRK
jgi:PIN domain nuclease of toxin-antitoxin system